MDRPHLINLCALGLHLAPTTLRLQLVTYYPPPPVLAMQDQVRFISRLVILVLISPSILALAEGMTGLALAGSLCEQSAHRTSNVEEEPWRSSIPIVYRSWVIKLLIPAQWRLNIDLRETKLTVRKSYLVPGLDTMPRQARNHHPGYPGIESAHRNTKVDPELSIEIIVIMTLPSDNLEMNPPLIDSLLNGYLLLPPYPLITPLPGFLFPWFTLHSLSIIDDIDPRRVSIIALCRVNQNGIYSAISHPSSGTIVGRGSSRSCPPSLYSPSSCISRPQARS